MIGIVAPPVQGRLLRQLIYHVQKKKGNKLPKITVSLEVPGKEDLKTPSDLYC